MRLAVLVAVSDDVSDGADPSEDVGVTEAVLVTLAVGEGL